jgi:uncharacterized membrane protein (GlpM family)
MDDLFLIRLLLSFVTGFCWIAALTIIAERYGARTGGTLAGLPGTMLLAMLFIGITQSPAAAADATTSVPFVVGISTLFAVAFIALARKMALTGALLLALMAWGIAAAAYAVSRVESFAFSLAGYAVCVLVAWLLLERTLRVRIAPAKRMRYTPRDILLRGLVGGGTIALAVLMTRLGGPFLGGIFASLPAFTVALILIAHPRHGGAYTEGLLKSYIIRGSMSVIAFVIVVRYAYAPLGLAGGTALAFACSAAFAALAHYLVTKRAV